MAATNDKVIRLTLSDESLEFKFRVVCALKDQTFEERLEALIRADIAENYRESDEWISLQELLDELARRGHSVSRPTIRAHRQAGILPEAYFVETKVVSDAPFANKNQKSYYKKKECVRFYLGGLVDVVKEKKTATNVKNGKQQKEPVS